MQLLKETLFPEFFTFLNENSEYKIQISDTYNFQKDVYSIIKDLNGRELRRRVDELESKGHAKVLDDERFILFRHFSKKDRLQVLKAINAARSVFKSKKLEWDENTANDAFSTISKFVQRNVAKDMSLKIEYDPDMRDSYGQIVSVGKSITTSPLQFINELIQLKTGFLEACDFFISKNYKPQDLDFKYFEKFSEKRNVNFLPFTELIWKDNSKIGGACVQLWSFNGKPITGFYMNLFTSIGGNVSNEKIFSDDFEYKEDIKEKLNQIEEAIEEIAPAPEVVRTRPNAEQRREAEKKDSEVSPQAIRNTTPERAEPKKEETRQESSVSKDTGSKFTEEQARAHVEMHNKYRVAVGNDTIQWDNELAKFAQAWAEKLAKEDKGMKHQSREVLGKRGENIFSYTRPFENGDSTFSVEKWHDDEKDNWIKDNEKDNMDGVHRMSYGKNGMVGHFTQVLWNKATKLGAGYANSKSGHSFIVTNYDAGNMANQNVFKDPKLAADILTGKKSEIPYTEKNSDKKIEDEKNSNSNSKNSNKNEDSNSSFSYHSPKTSLKDIENEYEKQPGYDGTLKQIEPIKYKTKTGAVVVDYKVDFIKALVSGINKKRIKIKNSPLQWNVELRNSTDIVTKEFREKIKERLEKTNYSELTIEDAYQCLESISDQNAKQQLQNKEFIIYKNSTNNSESAYQTIESAMKHWQKGEEKWKKLKQNSKNEKEFTKIENFNDLDIKNYLKLISQNAEFIGFHEFRENAQYLIIVLDKKINEKSLFFKDPKFAMDVFQEKQNPVEYKKEFNDDGNVQLKYEILIEKAKINPNFKFDIKDYAEELKALKQSELKKLNDEKREIEEHNKQVQRLRDQFKDEVDEYELEMHDFINDKIGRNQQKYDRLRKELRYKGQYLSNKDGQVYDEMDRIKREIKELEKNPDELEGFIGGALLTKFNEYRLMVGNKKMKFDKELANIARLIYVSLDGIDDKNLLEIKEDSDKVQFIAYAKSKGYSVIIKNNTRDNKYPIPIEEFLEETCKDNNPGIVKDYKKDFSFKHAAIILNNKNSKIGICRDNVRYEGLEIYVVDSKFNPNESILANSQIAKQFNIILNKSKQEKKEKEEQEKSKNNKIHFSPLDEQKTFILRTLNRIKKVVGNETTEVKWNETLENGLKHFFIELAENKLQDNDNYTHFDNLEVKKYVEKEIQNGSAKDGLNNYLGTFRLNNGYEHGIKTWLDDLATLSHFMLRTKYSEKRLKEAIENAHDFTNYVKNLDNNIYYEIAKCADVRNADSGAARLSIHHYLRIVNPYITYVGAYNHTKVTRYSISLGGSDNSVKLQDNTKKNIVDPDKMFKDINKALSYFKHYSQKINPDFQYYSQQIFMLQADAGKGRYYD